MAAFPPTEDGSTTSHTGEEPGRRAGYIFAFIFLFFFLLALLGACSAKYSGSRVASSPGAFSRNRVSNRDLGYETRRREVLEYQRQLSHLEEKFPVQNYGTFVAQKMKLSNDICVICLENFKTPEKVRMLRCGHVHHSECLGLWACWRHYYCPTCRAQFAPPKGTVTQWGSRHTQNRIANTPTIHFDFTL